MAEPLPLRYYCAVNTVYIALGSNLGNREENLARALEALGEKMTIVRKSSLYDTEPMYETAQPRFLNMAVEAETSLPPKGLLEFLKSIEKRMGKHEHNQPRVIDLDLLFYGDRIVQTLELTIPHPGIEKRAFVLDPMCEVAPDFVHPVLGTTISELRARL